MKVYVAVVLEVDGNIRDKELLKAHIQQAVSQFHPHVETADGPVEVTDAVVEEEDHAPITPEDKSRAQRVLAKLRGHPTPR
jgi:hypothetical protein